MANEPLVLAVDDEAGILRLIRLELSAQGFRVITASGGEQALKLVEDQRPDIVLLDVVMPGMTGLEVLRAIRERWTIPVVMVTARDREIDKVRGLEMGADDYIVKPFSMRELVARLRMVLRRARAGADEEPDVVTVADVVIDRSRHTVSLRGQDIALSPKEFGLLEYLARHRGRALTRATILEHVWGGDEYIDEHTVDVHIRWLRQKLEADPGQPALILTVRGVGYRLAG